MQSILYLQQALSLALTRQGFCAPNPAVGAIIVKNDQVLATGYHYAPGYPHAEADALNKLGDEARGATIYVTLEPCCVWGRTPPCTELLIARGIQRVVYGFQDPNPQVRGQGIQMLQQAGIDCEYQPVADISEFYQPYEHWWHTGMPFVTAKLALSLDGKIANANNQPITITGAEAAKFTHQQRVKTDAILTTVRTILCDDPQLNARLESGIIAKPLYILDTHLATPSSAKVWQTAQNLTFFHSDAVAKKLLTAKQQAGARCIAVPQSADGLAWQSVLKQIAKDGMHSVWLEAGGQAFESLLQSGYCQQAYLYIAAKVLGDHAYSGLHNPLTLTQVRKIVWLPCGKDVICYVKL